MHALKSSCIEVKLAVTSPISPALFISSGCHSTVGVYRGLRSYMAFLHTTKPDPGQKAHYSVTLGLRLILILHHHHHSHPVSSNIIESMDTARVYNEKKKGAGYYVLCSLRFSLRFHFARVDKRSAHMLCQRFEGHHLVQAACSSLEDVGATRTREARSPAGVLARDLEKHGRIAPGPRTPRLPGLC